MKKKHFLFICILLSSVGLFAFEQVPTEQLLLSYLQNDMDLQKLTIAAEKADLSNQSINIDTGIDISLSSGTITFKTSKDGLQCTTSPNIKVNIPQASNLSISTGMKINSNSNKVISDGTISLGVDIISTNKLSNDISKLNSERNKNIALRNLEEKAIEKEKAFYSELKALLNSINQIIQSEKKLYTDIKDFETVKARGFSETSSTYRMAEIQVFSDKTTIDTQKKSFVNDFIMFYKKCGYDISLPENIDVMELVPNDIPFINPVDVTKYEKEKYKEIENTKWNHKINSMKRDLNSNFSLSANGGYTFNNSLTNSDTINAGISSTIGGLNIQAGITIPVTSSPYPSFTIAAGITPNTFKKNNIKAQQDNLTEKQELIDIQIAENNYENFVISSTQTLEELWWKNETTKKNYEMYNALEKDMKTWFNQGLISESEYLSAKTNANMYKVKSVINQIDFIIYNDDVNKHFVHDISQQKK